MDNKKLTQELLYGIGIYFVCVSLFGVMFGFGVICILFAYFMTHDIPDIELKKILNTKDKNNGNNLE